MSISHPPPRRAGDNRQHEATPRRGSMKLASIKCLVASIDNQSHQTKPTRRPAQPDDQLASTFGTLLSSQRSDAHPSWPLGRSGGNLSNLAASLLAVKLRFSRCLSAWVGAPLDAVDKAAASLGGSHLLGPASRSWAPARPFLTGRQRVERLPSRLGSVKSVGSRVCRAPDLHVYLRCGSARIRPGARPRAC